MRPPLLTALCALAVLGGAPASAATTPAPQPPVPVYRQLSNYSTLSRWSYADAKTPVRVQPSLHSREITRLHYFTEDGYPEIYLLAQSYTDAQGRQWIEVHLPRRPNGTTGWVPRSSLDTFHTVSTLLVVDTEHLRVRLYRAGRLVMSAPAGVGRPGLTTPRGLFWIRERLSADPRGPYGPLAFGTSDYSSLSDWPGGGVVGIHGTDQPALIPGRPSHGCVRLRNSDILRLGRLMPIGTPLRII